MELNEIIKEIRKLDNTEKNMMILNLLIKKDIDFTELSKIYVSYLERLEIRNKIEKRLIADCLSLKYAGFKHQWLDARSSILLEPYVRIEFIAEHIKKDLPREVTEKEKKFIEESLNI